MFCRSPVILQSLMTLGLCTVIKLLSLSLRSVCTLLWDAGTRWWKPHFNLAICSVLGSTKKRLYRESAGLGKRRRNSLLPVCLLLLWDHPSNMTAQWLGHFLSGATAEVSWQSFQLAEQFSSHPSLRDTSISTSLGLSPSDSSSKFLELSSSRPTFKLLFSWFQILPFILPS